MVLGDSIIFKFNNKTTWYTKKNFQQVAIPQEVWGGKLSASF